MAYKVSKEFKKTIQLLANRSIWIRYTLILEGNRSAGQMTYVLLWNLPYY